MGSESVCQGFADKPTRAVRILLDGDSTIAVGSFVGEAAHSILQERVPN